MNARTLLQRPPWLPHSTDNSYYIGAYWITPDVWKRIFESLSVHPELFDFDTYGIGEDLEEYIEKRLSCLLPDSNYHYSHEQVAIWISLMTSPMTVSNEDLQKIIPMQQFELATLSEDGTILESPGFFLCTWVLSVSEYHTLVNYLKSKERTFNELVVWDTFIIDTKLGPTDKIHIRYIGSVGAIAGPIKPMAEIFDQTEDARSGILADFLKALVQVLPTVVKSCECHIIQHIEMGDPDIKEDPKFHSLIHSVLIEFFGGPSLLNRHPDSSLSQSLNERSALDCGLGYSLPTAAEIRTHFKTIEYIIPNEFEAGCDQDDINGMFRLDEALCAALLDQLMLRFYKGDRAISEEHLH